MSNWDYFIFLDIDAKDQFLYWFIICVQFISLFTPTMLMSRLLRNNLGYKNERLEVLSTIIIGFTVLRFSYTITSYPYPTYIGYLIYFFVILLCCRGSLVNKCFWAVLLPIYLNLASQIFYVIPRIIQRLDLGLDFTFTVSSQMQIVPILILVSISVITLLALYFLFNSMFKKYKVSSPIHLSAFLILLVLSLGINNLSIEYIPDSIRYADDKYLIIILVSNFIGLLVLSYSFYSFKKIEAISFDKLALSSKIIEQTVQLEYFTEIEASTSVLRKWNHDFAQHMEVINTLAQNGAYVDLGDYVSKLRSSAFKFNFILDTGFKTVDAVISQKIILSEGKGITFTKQIIFPSDFAMSQTDFCIILSNLLDNAIESCAKLSDHREKYIDLSIRFNDDMLFISIKNSSMGDHIKHDGYFLTTKIKDAALHGIGLRRVVELATLNKGICNFEAGDNMFTASLALPLREDL